MRVLQNHRPRTARRRDHFHVTHVPAAVNSKTINRFFPCTIKNWINLSSSSRNYLECWKQFNYFVNLARSKKFSAEDENQFLEVKAVIVQELELITRLG